MESCNGKRPVGELLQGISLEEVRSLQKRQLIILAIVEGK